MCGILANEVAKVIKKSNFFCYRKYKKQISNIVPDSDPTTLCFPWDAVVLLFNFSTFDFSIFVFTLDILETRGKHPLSCRPYLSPASYTPSTAKPSVAIGSPGPISPLMSSRTVFTLPTVFITHHIYPSSHSPRAPRRLKPEKACGPLAPRHHYRRSIHHKHLDEVKQEHL